ncbi:MAG: hypothetical protein JW940_00230 [Polyangiaceae bacterium]|nr:hypothetical protein [Polyangiaceae bacterium]
MCVHVSFGAPLRLRFSGPAKGRPGRVLALLGTALLAVSCGSDGGGSATPLRQAVDEVCQRAARCAQTTFDAEEMQECRQLAGTLGLVLPDPTSFAACMRKLDCDELLAAGEDPSVVRACIDLDPTSVRCGAKGLLACTNAGYCSEIDCNEACTLVGAQYESCGESDEHPYEVCRCTY